MKNKYNAIICGVGGQGVLTITRLLGVAALSKGFNVVTSEVHGMAQRGGSVVVHLKIGSGELSPLIARGSADLLVAMELYEAIRSLDYASKDTLLLVNDRIIPPPIPGVRLVERDSILKFLEETFERLYVIDCEDLALKAGSRIAANIVMVGCIAGLNFAGLSLEDLVEAIGTMFSGKMLEVNLKALKLGFEEVKKLSNKIS